ncbi:MAG: hypothetical protein ACAH89_05965 [Rariglobus sp.]|nr:hypothetical protein [Rariglobus sp.]
MSKTNKTARKATETRQDNFKHEASILAVGQLYYLMAFGLVLAAITGVALHGTRGVLSWPDTLWVAGVFVAVAVLYAAVGYGFRKLATWSRYGVGALALLCLSSLIINPEVHHPAVFSVAVIRFFAMPVGVILTVYGAYLALTKKGATVLSADYRQVVADTPEVSYVYSRVFLAAGIVLMVVQSLKVLSVFIGKIG